MIYNGRSGDQANQQFAAGVYGRCFSGESLVGVKFKTVTGITSYKQYVGYESPLDYKDGIKNLLKNIDKDPQYKEYLRLKAIYE